MTDIREAMTEAVEQERATEPGAYQHVREGLADAADNARKRAMENGYRNPLVAPFFCATCGWTKNAHPHDKCATGFIPGDPDEVRAANKRKGF